MLRDVKVQDYMTTPTITVATTTPLRFAQQIMEDHHIRHLPVVQDNKLVGILSSGDIRRAGPSIATTLSIWEIAQLWEQITVEQVMNRQVIHVRPDTSITHAAQLMMAYHFNSLPVVDDQGYPIGILTDVDMFRLVIDASKNDPLSVHVDAEPILSDVSG
jgi:acetoin utilization protein AcuB